MVEMYRLPQEIKQTATNYKLSDDTKKINMLYMERIVCIINIFDTVKKVSDHCVKNCGCEGINILNANNQCAGQSVFHLHMHIIPRKNGDGLPSEPKFTGALRSLEENHKIFKM